MKWKGHYGDNAPDNPNLRGCIKVEISEEASKLIVQSIEFHLYEYGLDEEPVKGFARRAAISIAADIKRIILKDLSKNA